MDNLFSDPTRPSNPRELPPLERSFFEYLLDLEVRKAARYLYYFSLLVVRLDPVPGETSRTDLKATLEFLVRDEIRETDLIGLWGNSSIFIILQYSDLQNGVLVGERVRERVAHYEFEAQDSRNRRTVSIGVTCFPTNANEVKSLIQRTEEMLSRAQQLGGNRVCVPEA